MSSHTLVLDLPEPVYVQLEAQAQASKRSLNDLALQNLVRSLPPIEAEMPLHLQKELADMAHLSDHALWQIAQSRMNEDEVALYDVLLERHQNGTLTSAGQQWLTQLGEEADALMLRKAHAYLLLKNRGHVLPTRAELHAQFQ